MKWFLILFIIPAQALVETPLNITSTPCTDSNHIFLSPGVLTAGGTARSCISRFFTDGPANVVLTLVTDGGFVTAMRDLEAGDGGCIDISVPQLPNTRADLTVNIRYPEAHCTWERHISLRIASGRIIAIHTERAKYKPGDVVRIRAIALKADLTPTPSNIEEIWLEGPRGTYDGIKMAQWLKVRTRLGLAQVQHNLDESPPIGKWTVRAKLADGSQGAAAFWVGNYVIPPFQLTVRHSPRILRTSERLVWTVCVRYPWSEAVEGMLVIRLRGAGGAGGAGGPAVGGPAAGAGAPGGVRTAVRLRARACHRHAAAARRVGLRGPHAPDIVIADFSFQEEGTRVWQNTTVVSQVVNEPVTIEFLTRNFAVVSPGLPYRIKIKATKWDDKPASNETVTVCRYKSYTLNSTSSDLTSNTSYSSNLTSKSSDYVSSKSTNSSNSLCVKAVTDEKGLARVMFGADNDPSPFYNFKAVLHNSTATMQAWSTRTRVTGDTGSNGDNGINGVNGVAAAALGALKAEPRTLLPLYLSLPGTDYSAITVHFVVITRGGTIYRWGATTQCPTTTDKVHLSQRDMPCPRIEPVTNGELSGLSRVLLPVRMTHQMCPDSHLVVYFKFKDEIVTASKHFMMDDCFVNKVQLKWASRQTPPGTTTELHINTQGPALCALSVLDTATRAPNPNPTPNPQNPDLSTPNPADGVLSALRNLVHAYRNLTLYDAAGDCFLTSDTPDLPTSGIELMSFWLASAGVRLLTTTDRKRCSSTPSYLMDDDAQVPRSDFSESWLWRLVGIGQDNQQGRSVRARVPDSITRYEASAICVSRTGISVSSGAVLQVFREFFIHASGPRSLKRGDVTIIPYRIFNYLYQPLNVKITISSELQSTNTCIAARSSVARRVEVTAERVGTMRVRIRAESLPDFKCSTHNGSVSDEVMIEIKVEPEGVPIQEHKSALLCGPDSQRSDMSTISWTWPEITETDTEVVSLWASGNVLGPLLYDADALVQLPRGCGEQNMARLATNLLALRLLDKHSVAYLTAKDHVARGFARQLQYLHPSGGFSAFGASDSSASTWLTAFCVRYMREAYQVISGSSEPPAVLIKAENWLKDQQMENGCFRNHGHVFHTELKGGLNEDGDISSVALTAYVLTSLLNTPLSYKIIENTLSCLHAFPTKSKKIYALSLLTYAYSKLRQFEEKSGEKWNFFGENGQRDFAEEMVVLQFMQMATSRDGYMWWDTGNLATSIEATSYALQALTTCGALLRGQCAAGALGAARWLSSHRDGAGALVSTQDTLIALEALSTWAHTAHTDAAVSIRSGRDSHTLHLSDNDKVTRIPVLGDYMNASKGLNVTVEGSGCALVQVTRSYHSLNGGRKQNGGTTDNGSNGTLSVRVRAKTRGAFDCDGDVCFCAVVVELCAVWWAGLPALALLELSLPGGYALHAAQLYALLRTHPQLLRRIEVTPSNTKASLYVGARDGAATPRAGHACYDVRAAGPRARTRPAHAKILDYYRPYVDDAQMYTIPEDCPSPIAEEVNEYNATDNLFNKARSLTESGEIIISHEYTLDDIPEGIPLEDPIYDNLTKRDDEENNDNTDKNNDDNNIYYKINENGLRDENDILLENIVTESPNINKGSDKNDLNNIIVNNKQETNYENVIIINSKQTLKTKTNFYEAGSEINAPTNIETSMEQVNEKEETINPASTINKDESALVIKNTEEKDNNYETFINNDESNEIKHKIHIRDDSEDLNITIEEPKKTKETEIKEILKEKDREALNHFSSFHIIDSERDLEVPSGVEGPIPAVVMPPKNYVIPRDIETPQYSQLWRSFPNQYYQPIYYKDYQYTRNKHINIPIS